MPKNVTPAERNLLVCMLKLTRAGPIRKELIAKEARIPHQDAKRMLKKFSDMGLIQFREEVVEASSSTPGCSLTPTMEPKSSENASKSMNSVKFLRFIVGKRY